MKVGNIFLLLLLFLLPVFTSSCHTFVFTHEPDKEGKTRERRGGGEGGRERMSEKDRERKQSFW